LLIEDPKAASAVLTELKTLGVHVASTISARAIRA
jgi:hypothetical protein